MKLNLATSIVFMFFAVGIAQADSSYSPFSRQETEVIRSVWPDIRQARDFADIDWRSVGFRSAPGDEEAQRLMSEHWTRLRGAAEFDDIDWRAIRDDEDRSSGPNRGDRGRDYTGDTGPFSRDDARQMRAAWPKIREAENYVDINWRAIGFARAPGDRAAREFMAERWESLRRAAKFDDIDWQAEYPRR